MLCHFGIILPTIIDVGQWGSFFIHPEHLLLCYVMLIKNPLLLHLSPFFLVPPWTSSRTLVPIIWPSSWSWMTSESLGEGGFNPARMSWWGGNVFDPQTHCSHCFEYVFTYWSWKRPPSHITCGCDCRPQLSPQYLMMARSQSVSYLEALSKKTLW